MQPAFASLHIAKQSEEKAFGTAADVFTKRQPVCMVYIMPARRSTALHCSIENTWSPVRRPLRWCRIGRKVDAPAPRQWQSFLPARCKRKEPMQGMGRRHTVRPTTSSSFKNWETVHLQPCTRCAERRMDVCTR